MIYRKSIQETTGNKTNVAQSFKHNIFFDSTQTFKLPFAFDVPQYTTIGGTVDYYDQNPLAIFTNLVKPFIRFDFSANTSSFGPNVFIKHDIYRVSWDVFSTVQSGLNADSDEAIQSENLISETIEEFDESTGEFKRKTITRNINELKNEIKSSRKAGNIPTSRKGDRVIKPTIADIQKQLDEPIFSITAATTGITTNIYDLQIDQYTKNLGEYKTELFKDRDQYIIDTNFVFYRTGTTGLQDLIIVDNNQGTGEENTPDAGVSPETPLFLQGQYKAVTQEETSTEEIFVEFGEFKGLKFVGGEYFSYFQVPDKPTFDYPTPEGQISTFTPEIFWTNGENADEYLVQVNYNTGDTGFTGTVFSYIVPKSDEFKEEAVSKTKDSSTEFSTTKAIRKYQLSLKSNQCLIYRVGNVKVLNNIFGVRQSVVTFSDNKSICTQVEPIKTYVRTESDSPYIPTISGLVEPPSLDAESPLADFVLSGTVSGSTVTGATMQLIYPNSSFVTTPTNSVGEFSFGSLEAGTYTLNTTYRGYAMDSRQIVIAADTSVFIDIEIRWDNEFDIWAIKENDIIKY